VDKRKGRKKNHIFRRLGTRKEGERSGGPERRKDKKG